MLLKKFFKYVIPSMISMWIFVLYSIIDGIFVAWGVGEHALAAVNVASPFVIGIFSIAILFATGTSIMITRALGEGKEKLGCQLFSQNIVVLLVVSFLISFLALLNLDRIVSFLGGTEQNYGYIKEYIGTIAWFVVFFIVSYNLETFVKADGNPAISIIGVGTCGIMNVVLDYLFVIRFRWGVTGAALATGFSHVASTCIFLIYFLKFSKKLKLEKFKWNLSYYKKIIPAGLADGFTEISGGIVIFLFNKVILYVIGESGLVTYTIISYMHSLVLNAMVGISQGIQPLISYYYGAKDSVSFKKILTYALRLSVAFSVVVVLLLEVFPETYVGLFLDTKNQILFQETVSALRLYGVSFLMIGINVILTGYFTAVGKPAYSFCLSVMRGLILLTGNLIILATWFGGNGIWVSTGVTEMLCLFLSLMFYRKMKSKVAWRE